MAQKLYIGDVLAETVQFALKRWLTVLRLIWAPVLFSILLLLFCMLVLVDFSGLEALPPGATYEEVKAFFRLPVAVLGLVFAAAIVVCGLLFSGAMASIFRLVALGEAQPGLVVLRTDGPAVRTFFAFLIITVINYSIFGIALIAASMTTGDNISHIGRDFAELFGLVSSADPHGENVVPPELSLYADLFRVLGVTFFFAIIPIIYFNVRLAPFPAGTAVENRLLLFGSLSLTKGRFWSIFGTYFLLLLFVVVLSVIVELASSVLQLLSEGFASIAGAGLAVAFIIALIIAAAAVFFQVFSFGLNTAVRAVIYRRLKTGE